MVAVAVVDADGVVGVDPPVVVRERLEAFAGEVLAEATNRPVQMANGGLYLRGLIEQGPRKSLEPLVERLGEEADYHSMQQFLADSPWDPVLVVKAVSERVAPAVDVQAWVIDDTGFPKDGKDSPGVKRQYSGTLGKTGNCQIGVSVHAVGGKGTVPLGWALYLPEEWCEDPERRAKAKIPQEVRFKTKPELAVELVEHAAGWKVRKAPVLGDCAYGNNTELRDKLHAAGLQYVLSVSPETTVFAPETAFEVPSNAGKTGGRYLRPRPDRAQESIGALVGRLGERCLKSVSFRDGPRRQAGQVPVRLPARPRRAPLACECRQVGQRAGDPAPRGMADRRMAKRRRAADRLLAGQPARFHQARAARPPRAAALEDRAGLQTTQGRTRPRPLRGTLISRLVSPHRSGHRRPRLPHPGAP